MKSELVRKAEAVAAISKFNSCHDPSNGRFCEGPEGQAAHAASDTAQAKETMARSSGNHKEWQSAAWAHQTAAALHDKAAEAYASLKGVARLFGPGPNHYRRLAQQHRTAAADLAQGPAMTMTYDSTTGTYVVPNGETKAMTVLTKSQAADILHLQAELMKGRREVAKFNPNHDPATGRFTSGSGTHGIPGVSGAPSKTAQHATLRAYRLEDKAHRTGRTQDYQAAVDAHRHAAAVHDKETPASSHHVLPHLKEVLTREGRNKRKAGRVNRGFVDFHNQAATQLEHLASIKSSK